MLPAVAQTEDNVHQSLAGLAEGSGRHPGRGVGPQAGPRIGAGAVLVGGAVAVEDFELIIARLVAARGNLGDAGVDEVGSAALLDIKVSTAVRGQVGEYA